MKLIQLFTLGSLVALISGCCSNFTQEFARQQQIRQRQQQIQQRQEQEQYANHLKSQCDAIGYDRKSIEYKNCLLLLHQQNINLNAAKNQEDQRQRLGVCRA